MREDQQLVLADLYSSILLYGWQTFEQAEKAGAYALIIKNTHDAATGALWASQGSIFSRHSALHMAGCSQLTPLRSLAPLAASVLTVDAAFGHFKNLLLQHWYGSACRSRGIGSLPAASVCALLRPLASHPPHRPSVHRPPRSIALYSLSDAKLITEHAISAYFRHYKLYQVREAKRPCQLCICRRRCNLGQASALPHRPAILTRSPHSTPSL